MPNCHVQSPVLSKYRGSSWIAISNILQKSQFKLCLYVNAGCLYPRYFLYEKKMLWYINNFYSITTCFQRSRRYIYYFLNKKRIYERKVGCSSISVWVKNTVPQASHSNPNVPKAGSQHIGSREEFNNFVWLSCNKHGYSYYIKISVPFKLFQ